MLQFGLTVAFIGMGVVFGVLVFLIFVIKALNKITIIQAKWGKLKYDKSTVQDMDSSQHAVSNTIQEDPEEIVAVIAAALALAELPREKFIPIRRLGGDSVPAWFEAGHEETMSLKMFSY